MYTALGAGKVDVGRGVLTASLFNGAAQGVKVWIVADSGTNVPGVNTSYFTLVADPALGHGDQRPGGLKGKRWHDLVR